MTSALILIGLGICLGVEIATKKDRRWLVFLVAATVYAFVDVVGKLETPS